ncbi:helix-turn-helix domain-containing protein [Streptomyces justiciae]|uniref:Helix-turn-helix domain-containing protein n=1 Tax=Streptomyces justiciae TaxID=2780140 RepID=A0ABU3LPI3_9ACTN|nr:helix-turn-helix domain-containing protein [Streptomyces justiciae]MDT7841146.1 helix-turn-helix domain-containing protein [Streptomyces justiciae]
MYDVSTRKRALALAAQGRSLNSVSRETGISRSTIQRWLIRLEPLRRTAPCVRCQDPRQMPGDQAAYAHLLGLYLGDGHIISKPRQHYLSITCTASWAGLIDAAEDAMRKVLPWPSISRLQRAGGVDVKSYSKHWTCMFPQHGPGRKHERAIALEPWQQAIVDEHPWEFIRGLIHSDGCRITNWTTRLVAGERQRFEYPRYCFSNKSADIMRLFTNALDRVGVDWRQMNTCNISIARKASVALMDTHVGPKF